MNRKSFFAFAISLLAFVPGARAQYTWRITHDGYQDTLRYCFSCVSCAGENCTAACRVWDLNLTPVRIMFFRSSDGGLTWLDQDPGLRIEHTTAEENIWNIQQIDSLNVVAIGDSGLIVRTFDGGRTWIRQDLHTSANLLAVSFSYPVSGMVISFGTDTNVYLTNNSGNSWSGIKFTEDSWPFQCQSFGSGKYKIFTFDPGQFYSTSNSWRTTDTSYIYPLSDQFHILTVCGFGNGDTIAAVGGYAPSDNGFLVSRSTNGGQSWDTVPTAGIQFQPAWAYYPAYSNVLVRNGSLDIGGNNSLIAHSTNVGDTWQIEKVTLDTSSFPEKETSDYAIDGLTATSSGHIIGVYSQVVNQPSYLIEGEPVNSSVEVMPPTTLQFQVYPNPASKILNVESSSGTITISDPLGRSYEVKHNSNAIDISSLPSGVYFVSDGRSRAKFVKE